MMNLYGLGASPELQAEVDGLLQRAPSPSTTAITDFLKLYPAGPTRDEAARALVASGVDSGKITTAMRFLEASGAITWRTFWGTAAVVSAAASGYHGIKRNNGSLGWGLWWFLMGGLFPLATPIVALARKPGFAKPR